MRACLACFCSHWSCSFIAVAVASGVLVWVAFWRFSGGESHKGWHLGWPVGRGELLKSEGTVAQGCRAQRKSKEGRRRGKGWERGRGTKQPQRCCSICSVTRHGISMAHGLFHMSNQEITCLWRQLEKAGCGTMGCSCLRCIDCGRR